MVMARRCAYRDAVSANSYRRTEVNKAQLIDALAERLGDKRTAGAAVDGIVDLIVRTVHKGERVNITGFGVFEKRARAARMARNPRTGEAVRVKKTNVPAFRAGTTFRDVIGGTKKLPKLTTGAAAARATGSAAATSAAESKSAGKASTAKASTAKTSNAKASNAKATDTKTAGAKASGDGKASRATAKTGKPAAAKKAAASGKKK
jgi:DNA-binding protein HU-beta